MEGLKRSREEVASTVTSQYFWDPFNVPSSAKKALVSQNRENEEMQTCFPCVVSPTASPNAFGKRVMEDAASDVFVSSKKGNFADFSSFSNFDQSPRKRSPTDPIGSDFLTKRSRLIEALQSKRRLDVEGSSCELRAHKKVQFDVAELEQQEDDDMALVCISRKVPHFLDEDTDDLWFEGAQLSRVPPNVFGNTGGASASNNQIVVWEDTQSKLNEMFQRNKKAAHPPMLAAANPVVPRVEVLDSSDEEEEGEKVYFEGIMPMDCSDY